MHNTIAGHQDKVNTDESIFPRLEFLDFSELDRQIVKFKELRDSFLFANRNFYGDFEQLINAAEA